MKNSSRLLGVIFAFANITGISATAAAYEETKIQAAPEKIYVESQDLAIEGKDLYVRLDQNWIRTAAVHSDRCGLYIEVPSAWPWTPFICESCERGNPAYNTVCDKCGTPRRD